MDDRPGCIDDETAAELLDGRLSAAARARAEAHADECDRCRTFLVECVRAGHATAATDPAPVDPRVVEHLSFLEAPGTQVGRYLLLTPLGRGGMAAVYRAYDPELQRQVAVKLLPGSVGDDPGARSRPLREAQALARVAHPNVVRVFDVGLHGDGVFVAMELLQGSTLNVWIDEQRPPPRRIRSALVGIGRGLAALHEAGLVHRDVKPSNVIVGADDVARLIDLGLACGPLDGGARPPGDPDAAISRLTAAGHVAGTPAYMAPEQYEGGAVTPATDQFSFCVMAYEVLFATRPFAGTTIDELRRNVLAGAIRPVTVPRQLDRRVHRAVVRGLAREPAARFPSIQALLAELGPRPARVARGAAAIAIAGAIAGAAAGYVGSRTAPPACPGDTAGVARVWRPDRRLALTRTLVGSGTPHAVDTAARVASRVDAYIARWRDGSRAACEATRVAGTQSEALLDRRVACLDRRLGALAALVSELVEHADARVVDHAVEAVAALPELDACDDLTALLGANDAPEERAFTPALDRIDSLIHTAQQARGLALAGDVVRRADLGGHLRAGAAARYRLGALHALAGDPAAAQRELEAALTAAAQARDDELSARCWTELVAVRGVDQAHHDIGLTLGLAADAAIVRAGAPWWLRAQLENNLGNLATSQGQFAEARDRHRRALALNEQHRGADDPQTATSLSNLANALDGAGALAEARAAHERALAIRRRALGDHHPYVAAALSNLAGTLRKLGERARALERLDEALAIARQSVGDRHMGVAIVLGTMGNVLRDLARHDEAQQRYTEALAITRAALPAHHPLTAQLLAARGEDALDAGRDAAARDDLEAAVASMTGADMDPVEDADARFSLARALRRLGLDRPRARALAVAARATYASAHSTAEIAAIDRWLAGGTP